VVRGIPNLPKIGGGYSRVVYVFENFIKNFVGIVRFVIVVKTFLNFLYTIKTKMFLTKLLYCGLKFYSL